MSQKVARARRNNLPKKAVFKQPEMLEGSYLRKIKGKGFIKVNRRAARSIDKLTGELKERKKTEIKYPLHNPMLTNHNRMKLREEKRREQS